MGSWRGSLDSNGTIQQSGGYIPQEVLTCPSSKKPTTNPRTDLWGWNNRVYGIFKYHCYWDLAKELADKMGYCFFGANNSPGYLLPGKMKQPSSFFVFADTVQKSSGFSYWDYQTVDKGWDQGIYGQHRNRANVGHGDGHVASYTGEEARNSPMNVSVFIRSDLTELP